MKKISILQKELAAKVITEDDFERGENWGGMDVSHTLFDPQKKIYAACVVLKGSEVIERAQCAMIQKIPYIPGYLGFREAPPLVLAYNRLKTLPSVILVDGHGVAHPRGLGIASHVGVLLGVPTIGVAKSILVGKPAGEVGPEVGDSSPLLWKGKTIGICLRTKKRCLPLIISSGHRVSLETAVDIVLEALAKYRLPEPTRQAHLAANVYRRCVELNCASVEGDPL